MLGLPGHSSGSTSEDTRSCSPIGKWSEQVASWVKKKTFSTVCNERGDTAAEGLRAAEQEGTKKGPRVKSLNCLTPNPG